MARFRYKMQSILDIKEKLESSAKQAFAEANRRLEDEKEKLQNLYDRKEAYLEEGVALRLAKLDVRKIRENKMAIMRMDEMIRAQRKAVDVAAKALEKARIKLEEVMKERKTHEKLKENAFQEFLQEENAAESKEIDQLTTYLHGQKLMGEKEDGK